MERVGKSYPVFAASETICNLSALEVALNSKNAPNEAQIRTFVGRKIHATAARLSDSFKSVSGASMAQFLAALSLLTCLVGQGQ